MAESYQGFDSGAGNSFASGQWRDIHNWDTGTLDGGLAVSAGSGMAVNVASGKAAVTGLWYSNSASLSKAIAAADPTNPRKDLVVIQADLVGQTVAAFVKTGTPAGSPVAPTEQRDSSKWELALAEVLVPANAVSSASFTITDRRVAAAPLNAATYTAADILTKIKTVDGSGSGLDADVLDGHDTSFFVAASAYTAADVLSKLLTVDGSGSGVDADLLDGHNSSFFQAASATLNADSGLITSDGAGALTQVVANVTDHIRFDRSTFWLYQLSRFTGGGSGTFTHGCVGQTPTHFSLTQSVSGSQTMGYNTPTSTQVTVVAGASNAWTGIAFVTG